MATTNAEIAKRAKVSPATVSRIFNQNGYVSKETRERVLALARELGYSPRKTSKDPLLMDKMKKIGLVFPDTCNAYYTDLIHGIESFFRPFGFAPIVCSTEEDPEKELFYLKVLQKISPAGIILVPTLRASAQTISLLQQMDCAGIPVVLLDRDIRSAHLDGVFMDYYSGAYQSTNAFLTNGHQNIAIICGSPTSNGHADRLQGYSDALSNQGIKIREEFILNGEFNFDCAYNACRDLFTKYPEVTAILSTSSKMTSGCIFAMAEQGLTAGKDIGLICYGQPDIGCDLISHVANPIDEMSTECGNLLLSKMKPNGKHVASRRRTFVDMKLTLLGTEHRII